MDGIVGERDLILSIMAQKIVVKNPFAKLMVFFFGSVSVDTVYQALREDKMKCHRLNGTSAITSKRLLNRRRNEYRQNFNVDEQAGSMRRSRIKQRTTQPWKQNEKTWYIDKINMQPTSIDGHNYLLLYILESAPCDTPCFAMKGATVEDYTDALHVEELESFPHRMSHIEPDEKFTISYLAFNAEKTLSSRSMEEAARNSTVDVKSLQPLSRTCKQQHKNKVESGVPSFRKYVLSTFGRSGGPFVKSDKEFGNSETIVANDGRHGLFAAWLRQPAPE